MPLRRRNRQRAHGLIAAPFEGGGGGVALEVDGPAAVLLLAVGEAAQVGGDDVGGEEGSDGTFGVRARSRAGVPPRPRRRRRHARRRRRAGTGPAARSGPPPPDAAPRRGTRATPPARARTAPPRSRRWRPGSVGWPGPAMGVPATAASCRATRWAWQATYAVICSDDAVGSASAQNGASPAGSATGSANGSPPSGRVTESSQSHSRTACGLTGGAASASASNACSAPAGWLSGALRSGSMPPAVPAVCVAVAVERGDDGVAVVLCRGTVEGVGESRTRPCAAMNEIALQIHRPWLPG
jgi:hypothetical protein